MNLLVNFDSVRRDHFFRLFRVVVGVLSAWLFIILAGGFLWAPTVSAEVGVSYQIDQTLIEGNRQIDAAAIKAQLKKLSGEISAADISASVKTLYLTGFFDQVSATVVPLPGRSERRAVKYVVVEKPLVRKIFIRGNKEVSEGDLADVLDISGKRFLDKARIESLMRRATTYYQSQGFYDAAFEYSVVPASEGQVDLTFTVTEGTRYRIGVVEFRGLSALDEDDLRAEIQTKRYKWWNSWLYGTGRLNTEMLENDKALLRQYLLDHGLIDGSVSDPVIEKRDGGLRVVFDVVEGPTYKFGQVKASGDLKEESVEKTIEGVKAISGEVFSASALRDDSFKVSEKFTDSGYAFANVVPDTEIDRKELQVNVNYRVTKGQLVSVNRINIKGNTKTYDNVIRRELKIAEQETFSSSKVQRSQALLQRLGYFEEASISTEPTDSPKEVNLNVNVREGSTGSFSAGAGYSSSDGALVNARVSEDNIFGTGRRVVVNADLGTQKSNLNFSVSDDRFLDSNVALGTDIFRTYREYSDFDRKLTGAAFSVGYPLEELFGEWAQDLSASVRYEYNNIDISNVDPLKAADLVIKSQGTSTASSIIPRLVRNTINNPLNPSRGSKQILTFEYAGVGGSQNYYLFDFRHQYYYPFMTTRAGDLVFSWRFGFGYGDSLKDNEVFPLFKRFFPGGINSVRGYKNRTLGPKDSRGNEFGGSKEIVTNFEVIFPLVSSAGLKGVVFYDLGQAFDDDDSISLSDLRKAYGFGIRWTSPLGPIRIEFGLPISKRSGESSLVTLFAFGAPF